MHHTIRKVQQGDAATLAYIQTESWKAAFGHILSPKTLERCTQMDRATAMYQKLLDGHIGNGYILELDGKAHCIAYWDKARDADMPGYAELICIHSLPDNWGRGFGTRMMERVLHDIREAGYGRMMLWVFTDNVRARGFYEARGFVTYGKVKDYPEAQEICYEREL